MWVEAKRGAGANAPNQLVYVNHDILNIFYVNVSTCISSCLRMTPSTARDRIALFSFPCRQGQKAANLSVSAHTQVLSMYRNRGGRAVPSLHVLHKGSIDTVSLLGSAIIAQVASNTASETRSDAHRRVPPFGSSRHFVCDVQSPKGGADRV